MLDNGIVRVGLDLSRGGAITHLSRGDGPNRVNNHDLGRQIQMSYYSGPIPYEPGGRKPMPFWSGLGWNPIQSGDVYNNRSRVLESRFKKTRAYVKSIPMHWPLDNVPGECVFESWVELRGPVAHLRQRITNRRDDKTQYPARPQELPAVYLNGPWHRLITYRGDRPFTNAPTEEVPKRPWDENGPWTTFHNPECWAALLDDQGDGVGVWSPGNPILSGGFVGEPGKGGTLDGPTGYIAPIRTEILDHNIAFESRCSLIVGNLSDIRGWVARQPRPPARPSWRFQKDRQGWHLVNASDRGWPVRGFLDIALDRSDPQLVGPPSFWRAADAPVLVIDARSDQESMGEVFWSRHDAPSFSPERRLAFRLPGDGRRQLIRVRLSDHPEYRAALTQIRIDPAPGGIAGSRMQLYGVWLERGPASG